MPLYTVIECIECGHKIFVDDEWILEKIPNLAGKGRSVIILNIRLLEKRLTCNECGKKLIKISAINEKKLMEKNERTLKPANNRYWVRRIDKVMEYKNWMYLRENKVLESIQKQVLNGRNISEKQKIVVKGIEKCVRKRLTPKIIQGGSPGLGRRK